MTNSTAELLAASLALVVENMELKQRIQALEGKLVEKDRRLCKVLENLARLDGRHVGKVHD